MKYKRNGHHVFAFLVCSLVLPTGLRAADAEPIGTNNPQVLQHQALSQTFDASGRALPQQYPIQARPPGALLGQPLADHQGTRPFPTPSATPESPLAQTLTPHGQFPLQQEYPPNGFGGSSGLVGNWGDNSPLRRNPIPGFSTQLNVLTWSGAGVPPRAPLACTTGNSSWQDNEQDNEQDNAPVSIDKKKHGSQRRAKLSIDFPRKAILVNSPGRAEQNLDWSVAPVEGIDSADTFGLLDSRCKNGVLLKKLNKHSHDFNALEKIYISDVPAQVITYLALTDGFESRQATLNDLFDKAYRFQKKFIAYLQHS